MSYRPHAHLVHVAPKQNAMMALEQLDALREDTEELYRLALSCAETSEDRDDANVLLAMMVSNIVMIRDYLRAIREHREPSALQHVEEAGDEKPIDVPRDPTDRVVAAMEEA